MRWLINNEVQILWNNSGHDSWYHTDNTRSSIISVTLDENDNILVLF